MSTTTNYEKIQKAIEIFKAKLPGVKGKFRPYVSEANGNEVDFFSDDGLYCTVNIRVATVRGI